MNPKLMRVFAALIAIALIAGFVLMYGYIIWKCWHSADCGKYPVTSQFVYVATGLAGLIGGVVAMMFNEKLPVTSQSATDAPANGGQVASASGANATFQAAAAVLTPSARDALQTISVLYVVGYFATGLAAIITWVLINGEVLDLIKNLALIAFGLLLAVARSFLTVPPPQT
jgi:hypothetical protein